MASWQEMLNQVERNIERTITDRVVNMIPEQCHNLMDYILSEVNVRGMTGNTWNGFGVGAYKDGTLMYKVLSWETLGKEPIRKTLSQGEHFHRGKTRWDDTVQEWEFTAKAGAQKALGGKLASDFMDKHRPTFTKGICFCVVSAVDYSAFLEFEAGVNLIQNQQMAIARMGAQVTEIMTGV